MPETTPYKDLDLGEDAEDGSEGDEVGVHVDEFVGKGCLVGLSSSFGCVLQSQSMKSCGENDCNHDESSRHRVPGNGYG